MGLVGHRECGGTASAHEGMTMAEAAKLTDAMIRKARLGPQQKQKILWDTAVTGFGLRILAGGSKTFWFQYRPPGGRSVSSRMVRIGPWPSVSLTDARKAARAYWGAVARGDDPAADKQEERRRASSTLRTLLAEGGEYERHLKRRHIVNTKTIMSTCAAGSDGSWARTSPPSPGQTSSPPSSPSRIRASPERPMPQPGFLDLRA